MSRPPLPGTAQPAHRCACEPRAVALASALTLLALLFVAGPAAGHSALARAIPAVDGTTDQPVDRLTLVFGQPVDVLADSVQVIGPDGAPLPSGPAGPGGDRATVVAELSHPLPPGTSTVLWRVIGQDGHPIEGSYTITSTAPPPSAEPSTAATPSSEREDAANPPATDAPAVGAAPPPPASPPPASDPETVNSPGPADDPTHAATEIARADTPAGSPGSGAAAPPAVIAQRGEPAAPRALQTAGRWLVFASILAAVGVVAFGIAVHPESWQDQDVLTRLVVWSAAGIASGAVLQVAGHVAVISGDGLAGVADADAWRITRRSGLMIATVLRLAGAAVLLLPLRGYRDWSHDIAHMGPMVVGSLALLSSFQFTGHTVTSEPRLLVRLADLTHVGAAAVWTGGVVALAAVMAARRRRGDGSSLVVGRFSVAATASVVLVGVAGSALALVELDGLSQLVSTGYGLVLLGKLGIVAVVGAVGAFNHTWLVPAVVAGDADASSRLQRMMRLELALLPLAIALTAVLVKMSP